jgi:DNA adenine methylase
VYNDRDGDLVQFFEVLRERCDELVEWLSTVPYSRELYDDWATLYYQGYRPKDAVSRAGRFFFLRYTQWGARYDSRAGFGTSKVSSRAKTFANKIDRLHEFSDRFDDVVLENLDWRRLVEKYDSQETVFYFDPPYVDAEDYYPVNSIDHDAFVAELTELEGNWLCSYEDLPPIQGEEITVMEKDGQRYINNGLSGSSKDATERLLIDPEVDVSSVGRPT